MKDKLIMNRKERERKAILERYHSGGVASLVEASHLMRLSYRQTKRVWHAYLRKGDVGLVHRLRGQAGHHRCDANNKTACLQAYSEHYRGYGPTFASEKLAERNHLYVHPETLRRWLRENHLWYPHRHHHDYRCRRPRRACFGELVQVDGSLHPWFGEGSKHDCLFRFIDDATSVREGWLAPGETLEGAFIILRHWIEKYGIPEALYVDLRTTYVSPGSKKKALEVNTQLSQFERACQALDIKIIKAYSAQAKGRVERSHQVDQDRLVKEISLRKLHSIDEVNAYMEEFYTKELNRKFSIPPLNTEDKHRPCPAKSELDNSLCYEYRRQLNNDYTIRFKTGYYQLERSTRKIIRPKHFVTVREHLDGRLTLWYKKQLLAYKKINKPEIKIQVHKDYSSSQRSLSARRNKNHSPWSLHNRDGFSRRKSPT